MGEHGSKLEIPVDEAHRLAGPGRPLYDVRPAHERAAGDPAGSVPITIESLVQRCADDPAVAALGGLLICSEGVRSLEAARRLQAAGIGGFVSVQGGFTAWRQAGLPVRAPAGFDPVQAERYARHLVMPQVGPEGQKRLRRARVLLVGLGGLNAPAALYLAAAGVGSLGLCDPDRVERSNLQRQVVHAESSIGRNKAQSAQARIADLNPDVETERLEFSVHAGNADELVRAWDIVLDGTDNFEARYALNDACLRHGRPLVYGAVMRFQGQVSVFCSDGLRAPAGNPARRPPCFRCLLPEPPPAREALSCAEAGVLGVLPGIVGTLQASEALKLALGIGRSLAGRLLLVDALTMNFREARVPRRDDCASCGRGAGAGS